MTFHLPFRRRPVGLLLLAVLLCLAAPAALAITAPGVHGVAKDRGFTLTPPWARGDSHSMTCGYGCYKHDNDGTQDYFALDFPMPAGTPVYPAAPGRVLLAEDAGGGWEPYGNIVFVQHLNGYQTLYAHLQSLDVSEGDWVDPGAPLGTAGQTGSGASSDHLHFVLYENAYVGGSGTARGPAGGSAVVPEPFSGCTLAAGGDCEDLTAYDSLRRDDYAPEAVVHPGGALDLFTCARDSRQLLHRHRSAGGTWYGWNRLGGVCASSPTAARDASGRVYVFVRGTDGKLYYKRRDSTFGTFYGWYSLSGTVFGSAGVALDTVSGVLRVFSRRAPDDALYVASQSGTGFTGWSRLGGKVMNYPVAATRADGRVDAYVTGIDYNLWKEPALSSGGYTAENWVSQSVYAEGQPDLVEQGTAAWAVRSTSDDVRVQPGTVVAAGSHPPAVARNLDGDLHLFRRNRSSSAADYFYQYSGGSWSSQQSFGGLVTSALEAVRADDSDHLFLFTWGTGGLYTREQSYANATTGWGGWLDLQVVE
jgi:hypothetical protein